MEKPFDRRVFAGVLGALALAACNLDATPAPSAAAPIQRWAYRYDGVAGTSEVTHQKGDDGRESLRGTTEVAERPSSGRRTRTEEAASLDERGRLRHAEIVVSPPGSAAVRYTLDAAMGEVRVQRAGTAPVDWQVPLDAPWLYVPAASGDGALVTTPVAAWVALRAASSADVVRVLEPERQLSYLVTVDQVAVPTERGTTVALGNDGVDADAHFISELRLLRGTVTLARVAALDLVPRT